LQVEAFIELLEVWEPYIFRWMKSCSNRKMAWLWEAFYHPSLATPAWCILRNWLLTQQNTNHRCGSGMLMTFVVWRHDPERLQDFLSHLSTLRPSIQFTTEIESGSAIHFLDVLVVRKGTIKAIKVCRQPIHIG
jgi:hypothetical protein